MEVKRYDRTSWPPLAIPDLFSHVKHNAIKFIMFHDIPWYFMAASVLPCDSHLKWSRLTMADRKIKMDCRSRNMSANDSVNHSRHITRPLALQVLPGVMNAIAGFDTFWIFHSHFKGNVLVTYRRANSWNSVYRPSLWFPHERQCASSETFIFTLWSSIIYLM